MDLPTPKKMKQQMKGTQKKTAQKMKQFLFDIFFFFLSKKKPNKWCACSARLDGGGTRDLSARMLIVNWSGKSGVPRAACVDWKRRRRARQNLFILFFVFIFY